MTKNIGGHDLRHADFNRMAAAAAALIGRCRGCEESSRGGFA